jgi:hypothetical protein
MTEPKAQPGGWHIYTLEKDGVICCRSSLPGCGYSTEMLKELHSAGFELYEDGRKVKKGKA